jgi:hypothetical protein
MAVPGKFPGTASFPKMAYFLFMGFDPRADYPICERYKIGSIL